MENNLSSWKTQEQKSNDLLQRQLVVQLLASENLCSALAKKHEAMEQQTALAASSAQAGAAKMAKQRREAAKLLEKSERLAKEFQATFAAQPPPSEGLAASEPLT